MSDEVGDAQGERWGMRDDVGNGGRSRAEMTYLCDGASSGMLMIC